MSDEEAAAEARKRKGAALAKKEAPASEEKSVEHVEASGEEGVKVENIDLMDKADSSDSSSQDKVAKIENQD